jgi:FkbM family methyltransferase
MGLKSKFDWIIERVLPPRVFFLVSDTLRSIWNPYRRGGARRRVSRSGSGWVVEWEDGSSFAFVHPSRYYRYQWPDGLAHVQRLMLAKYQDGEVKIRQGDVVMEAGANVGEFTSAAASLASQVISFEPDPVAYECLAHNVSRLANVRVLRQALGNEVGSVDFYLSTEGADSSIIEPDTWSEKVSVPCTTLSEAIREQGLAKVGFLKVEAEGFEPEILQGAETVLARVRCVAVDCSPERGGESPFESCEAILHRCGFRTWRRESPGHIPMLFGVNQLL